ncbi:MAG TPA: DUF2344 domain-containing protein [Phycisphaerae bacterium]|nr:DUF2344 domain-containing protein [Phycisphaerae bacterium]
MIQLTDPLDAGALCRRLNEQLPPDVRVSAAAALPSRRCPQVRRIRNRVSLDEAESAAAAERIDALARMDQWTIDRPATAAGPGRAVDLKGGVEDLAVQGRTLRFALRAGPAGMPRCADVLALLGLTRPAGGDRVAATEALARTERTDIEYDLAPGGP